MKAKQLRALHHVRRCKRNKFVRRKLKLLLKAYKKRQVKISTKIGVVYERCNGEYVVLPYFDSSRKYQIWGVCIGDNNHKIMLGKEDFGKDAHVIANDSQFYVLSLHAFIKGAKLPNKTDVELITKHKVLIDDVMKLFVSYGLNADKLAGPYVIDDGKTSYEANPDNKMVVFSIDAENVEQFVEVGCFERYLTRLVKS